MKFLRTAVALSAFTLGAAYADDVKAGDTKASTKVEKTTKTDPKGAFNSTTDSTKMENSTKPLGDGKVENAYEKTAEHDAPGMKNDKKSTTKAKVVKDANGRVIEGTQEQSIK